MTPTAKLRFVQRFKQTGMDGSGNATGISIQVLQQWWTWTGTLPDFQDQYGEWRDVPLEKEQ